MLKVRILTRLNSQYGTFEPGDYVVNLPDDVARAWIDGGIAELPVAAAATGRQPLPDNPALDEMLYTEDDDPSVFTKSADRAGKRSSRKRTPATHPSGHEGPMREDPKPSARD